MAHAIGITGNIGSGKSTVGRLLEELGCRRIDADIVAHDVMKPRLPAWQAVVDRFGTGVLRDDGRIDRSKLGAMVFAEPAALVALDRAVHPFVRDAVRDKLKSLPNDQVAVVEAVKLLEAGMAADVDSVWLVVVPPDVAIDRLARSRGMAPDDAAKRLAAQPSVETKRSAVDVVIDNGGSLDDTRQQVTQAYRLLLQRWSVARLP